MTFADEFESSPEGCRLPAAERPLRQAEFDRLLGSALRGQRRVSPTVLRWELDPAAGEAGRDLAAREGECCSFFTFRFLPGATVLVLEVTVPAAYAQVLDALAAGATS